MFQNSRCENTGKYSQHGDFTSLPSFLKHGKLAENIKESALVSNLSVTMHETQYSEIMTQVR
jgi:hypothetical protein